MTDSARRKRIVSLIENYTKKNASSKKRARDTLIKEGIYTKKGELRPEFGGVVNVKKDSAA